MTLSDLRSLLVLAHGPAVERLEDRSPKGVARAYLPRAVSWSHDDSAGYAWVDRLARLLGADGQPQGACVLDLTDPGTVFAVRVALALALGLDPGPMGCAVCRQRTHLGWELHAADGWLLITHEKATCARTGADRRIEWGGSPIASEPDAVKALVLAVNAVLQAPAK